MLQQISCVTLEKARQHPAVHAETKNPKQIIYQISSVYNY